MNLHRRKTITYELCMIGKEENVAILCLAFTRIVHPKQSEHSNVKEREEKRSSAAHQNRLIGHQSWSLLNFDCCNLHNVPVKQIPNISTKLTANLIASLNENDCELSKDGNQMSLSAQKAVIIELNMWYRTQDRVRQQKRSETKRIAAGDSTISHRHNHMLHMALSIAQTTRLSITQPFAILKHWIYLLHIKMNALKNEKFLCPRNCDQFHSSLTAERENQMKE